MWEDQEVEEEEGKRPWACAREAGGTHPAAWFLLSFSKLAAHSLTRSPTPPLSLHLRTPPPHNTLSSYSPLAWQPAGRPHGSYQAS